MNWQQEIATFKQDLRVEAAVISAQAIRLGFFGGVGSGKSVTAGKCAVGITPSGLIGWVDGEGKRSGWASDNVAEMAVAKYGGTHQAWKDRFKIIHVDPPFNPLRVVAAIEMLEDIGCKTIILDIMTQAWDSDGGYLDLKDSKLYEIAGDDENKRKRAMASAAAQIKPWTHGKLVSKVNCSKCNLILLFQAKQKYNAKTFKPDDFVAPIQESGLTRTALAVGRVESNAKGEGGFCSFELPQEQGAKFTHHSILACLPKNGEQFQFEHGEGILRLCGGVPAASATTAPAASPEDKQRINALKKRLFFITREKHGGRVDGKPQSPEEKAATVRNLEQYLWDESFLDTDKQLSALTADELEDMLPKVEAKLKG